jgi:hypothetical protein
MLELGSSGSVRGVSSNGHPYRDPGPYPVGPAFSHSGLQSSRHEQQLRQSIDGTLAGRLGSRRRYPSRHGCLLVWPG